MPITTKNEIGVLYLLGRHEKEEVRVKPKHPSYPVFFGTSC